MMHEDVIRALKRCLFRRNCEGCPLEEECRLYSAGCTISKYALEVIGDLTVSASGSWSALMNEVKAAKIETAKIFAEELRRRLIDGGADPELVTKQIEGLLTEIEEREI